VGRALDALARTAESKENMMPSLLEAVRAEATLGEMCGALRRVWGEYVEEPSF
jgi:methylmalonyl-CoA mutase N-terminal domain/subunit